ncbi:FAD/NAD(P)-binding protein [Duganella vulcania]|uniref:FAD-dependent urate hydroxylase HpyO/Asp monooxygenase CreE-like FAD/NAD(P)-binding domain-containing protein n=1 Tax=Duganella vulcania TaxID=2692166 RepID=A0A845GTC2_9BURK|nr:FAD/NAD(P)-binding domain-containing protein [Duganella vulcania]MYM97281.1 hypothetical protein [Duganella vulcania]
MKRHSVTIIGMGPRGLSAFERLAAAAASLQLPLDLNLIEPGDCGPGVHSTRQPQHLLINTIASQVTLFPAPGAVQHAPVCATPSLTTWARQQGYRRVGERYYRLDGQGGAEITEADYLPRSLLGEYLAWGYRQIAAALPSSVRLTHHRLRATDLWRQPDGRHTVELETGYLVHSDFVVLTTGHGRNQPGALDAMLAAFAQEHARHNSRLAFVRHAYPLSRLDGIGAGTRVAIQGLGLSAHDIIAELTVGRGGAFVQGEDGLRYERSGAEPQLTLCSRHCLPAAARGVNQKGLDGRHQPRYFTPDAVEALRRLALASRGSRQLDFERELLPLLKREMGWVYRNTLATAAPDGAAIDPARYMLSADDSALIDQLLFPLRGREFDSLDEFRQFFTGWLRDDLAEARLGNVGSAVKAATDVLRDVRATLQAAVEHGGLTPASHRRFLEVYHPAINRVAFGPPLRRNQELLALLGAGVIEIASGPGCTVELDEQNARYALSTRFGDNVVQHQADVLVVARLDAFLPELDDSLLIRNVLKRGLARPYYNGAYHPGGLDIDAAGQPRDDFGQPSRNLWALGYLVEGAHYYTHALPRPGMRSRQVLDADLCVHTMLARMDAIPLPETRHAAVPASPVALPQVTL